MSELLPTEKTNDVRDARLAEAQDGSATPTDHPDESSHEDGVYFPGWWRLILVTVALSLAVFCMALDNTIIATAIPRITDRFDSINDIGWYGSVFLFGVCTFQLMYGKWYTFYPAKWVFMLALFLFELGSLVCGVAPSSAVFIGGRAISSVGAAGVLTGAILIVSRMVPLRQRSAYTSALVAMYGIASVAGPLLGGVFTDKLSWRWCFYVNLPLGALSAIVVLFLFRSPPPIHAETLNTLRKRVEQMDLEGTVVLIPSIVCLLFALQWGGSEYSWGNWRVILTLVLFAVLFAVFVAIQLWKKELATVSPRVFRKRNVWMSSFFAGCMSGAFFVLILFIPVWFQAIQGNTAVESGLKNLPMILGFVIAAPIAGLGISWSGWYNPFMILSSVLMATGAGLLTTFEPDTGHSKWIGYQAIFGLGVGLGFMQPIIAVQATLDPADVAVGTAITLFFNALGGAVFISAAQNVFANRLLGNVMGVLPQNLTGSVDMVEIYEEVGATELGNFLETYLPQYKDAVIGAYSDALTETWYIAVALSCLSIIGSAGVKWVSVKGKQLNVAAGV